MRTLKEKLSLCSIEISWYQEALRDLRVLGYSEAQANHIIVRKSSKNIVKKLLELHGELSAQFTHEQLKHIASHSGGSKNLEAVKACFTELKDLGFTAASIEKMVAHHGGSKNLSYLKDRAHHLLNGPLSVEQIIQQFIQPSKKRARHELEHHVECAVAETLTTMESSFLAVDNSSAASFEKEEKHFFKNDSGILFFTSQPPEKQNAPAHSHDTDDGSSSKKMRINPPLD